MCFSEEGGGPGVRGVGGGRGRVTGELKRFHSAIRPFVPAKWFGALPNSFRTLYGAGGVEGEEEEAGGSKVNVPGL